MNSMDHQQYPYHNPFERRPILKSKAPAVKWVKEWVPQDIVATGGKCYLQKWVTEDTLKRLKEKEKESDVPEPEPEPTTEVLFLCSYEGCGKTFFDASALRKHSHIHGERQYVCQVEGCGKKFLDSSKLKRHFLIHTGERDFVCNFEGCGKAFSLDFNLKSHMKTHLQENYHICSYSGCGKRYAHEYKLKNHIAAYHEKNVTGDAPKYTPPAEKVSRTVKTPATAYGGPSADRPYACPYEECEKAYIHEYKLKLHLKREHPGHLQEENAENPTLNKHNGNERNNLDEGSDQDVYRKHTSNGKSQSHKQQNRSKPNMRTPPGKAAKKGSTSSPANVRIAKKPWQAKETFEEREREREEEEDSEETEEDRENVDDGWRFGENNEEEDDEETEYED